jgi:hypothetical protein
MKSQDNPTKTELGITRGTQEERTPRRSFSAIVARFAPAKRIMPGGAPSLGRPAREATFLGLPPNPADKQTTPMDHDLLERIDLLACLFGHEDTKP